MVKSLKLWAFGLIPLSITLLLLLLYAVPKHVSGLGNVMPLLQLLPIYIWGLLHARDMPYMGVALIGLLTDAATGLPLGLSGVLYCLFVSLLTAQRKYIYKEGFVAAWGYFALLLLLLQALTLLALFMMHGVFYSVTHALVQWALTVALYPLAHRIFYRIAEAMSHQRYRWLHA